MENGEREIYRFVCGLLSEGENPQSALFFADKLLSLNDTLEHRKLYARALFACGEFRQCLEFLCEQNMLGMHDCLLLAVKSCAAVGETQRCIDIFDMNLPFVDITEIAQVQSPDVTESTLWLLRAKLNTSIERKTEAFRCCEISLFYNPLCIEAIDMIASEHIVNDRELYDRVKHLFAKITWPWARSFIEARILARTRPFEVKRSLDYLRSIPQLTGNSDTLLLKAQDLFNHGDYEKCFEVCKELEGKGHLTDPQTVVLYASSLLMTERMHELSFFAQRLSELEPDKAGTWYAVGCFWFGKKDYEAARTCFAKATFVDKKFAAAWMAFGHTFARRQEHDQAIASYRTALTLFPGSSVPPLCIAIETARANRMNEAVKFFALAHNVFPESPILQNEMGCLHYKQKDYRRAREAFEAAIRNLQPGTGLLAETFYVNLGHCLRQLRMHGEARQAFHKSMIVGRELPGTLAAIGWTHHIEGNVSEAARWYNKSLALSEDGIVMELFTQSLKH